MTAPAFIPQSFRQGPVLEEIRGMSVTQLEHTKEVFKHNLWFASFGVLGYNQLYEPLHGPLCNFLVYCEATRRMVLMSRGFLKSTVCTISNPIRLACLDPNTYRACIENENLTKACSFLDEIKNHWMFNEALRLLFPELIPVKFAGPGSDWSNEQASLNAPRITRQSTWTCIGAGSSGTSYHFNHIIPDDLIGEKQKMHPAEMNTIKIWNRSQDQLLDSPATDRIDWIGTRKTIDDVYADTMEREVDLVVFHVEPFNDEGETVFPKIPTTWLEKKRAKDPMEWAHDYMNNPTGTGGMDWGKNVLFGQDFAFGEGGKVVFRDPKTKKLMAWSLRDLDIVMTCDPNKGELMSADKAAIVVHGVSPVGESFILDTFSGRPSPDGFIDKIVDMSRQWRPRVVGIEEAGQQNTFYYFEKRCRELGEFLGRPELLKHKNEEKAVRIRKNLDPYFRQRKMFFLANQYTLRQQIQYHPQLAAHNWDEIDCLAYGPRLYQNGITSTEIEGRNLVEQRILDARGKTGYGNTFRRTPVLSIQSESSNYLKLFGKGPR